MENPKVLDDYGTWAAIERGDLSALSQAICLHNDSKDWFRDGKCLICGVKGGFDGE